VNQQLIESIMDGMVSRSRFVDGVPTSLCDLGYCDVGLDDNWQLCGTYGDASNYNFHDESGAPVVNLDLFPDMKAMTDYAHSLGLTAGWYGNNCICAEANTNADKFFQGDVDMYVDLGFDGWKLDGCGAQLDLQKFDDMLTAAGKKSVVENCHWGSAVPFEPTLDWCPWNFYRTSGDVRADYASVMANLATTYKYADTLLSRPGCWAYPDMLEVGCAHGPGGDNDPGLSEEETRTHFGAWSIVSSPLTISMDVNNATIMDSVWDVVANKDAIAVNQAWFGHPGGPFKASDEKVTLSSFNTAEVDSGVLKHRGLEEYSAILDGTGATEVSAWQYLYKPMSDDGSKVAVLMMNSGDSASDLTLDFADVPGLKEGKAVVYCVWHHKEYGTFDGSFTVNVKAHDAAFFMISV
jgi:alpha-galactosidase